MSNEEKEKSPEWVLLTNVFDHIEYGIIKGILEMAEIPVVRKSSGIGGYTEILTGINFEGMDLLVPADRYEEAKELIKPQA